MKKILILGSTGSIGTQAIDVIKLHKDEFSIVGITANKNKSLFYKQMKELNLSYGALCGYNESCELENSHIYYGENAIDRLIENVDFDYVIVALVGMMGLKYVLKCLNLGKRILLANKESLVAGGKVVIKEVEKISKIAKANKSFVENACYIDKRDFPSPLSRILPIDSEHSAIFQCMASNNNEIDKIFLTCSGGPFRTLSINELNNVTKADALKHPSWNMGAKITIDSATLFNKALEMIEAKYLFGVDESQIQVLIHPTSIVHSMVGFKDKGIIAQLGTPSMKLPILYSVTYPKRYETNLSYPDLTKLEFYNPDTKKFPAIDIVRECMKNDDASCIAFNAANEVAVAYFLNEAIKFTDINNCVIETLNKFPKMDPDSYDAIVYADSLAREIATSLLSRRK